MLYISFSFRSRILFLAFVDIYTFLFLFVYLLFIQNFQFSTFIEKSNNGLIKDLMIVNILAQMFTQVDEQVTNNFFYVIIRNNLLKQDSIFIFH